MPIEIVDYSEDIVGKRLVYNIKEKIRESHLMRLTYFDEPRIKVTIASIAKFEDDPSVATIYKVVWLLADTKWSPEILDYTYPIYLNSTFGYCGSKRVSETAEGIVADTDDMAEYYQLILGGFK